MPRSTTVEKLLDLAHKRTDHAARRLASLNARERDAEERLKLLLAYRDDYFARFHTTASKGIDQDMLRNFQAFIQKLDAAITEQYKVVSDTRHGVQAGQGHWRAENRRLKSYDVLVQRERSAEALRILKHEQREQDEYAAKVHQRRKASA